MRFGANIEGPQSNNDFGHPLTFCLAPQIFTYLVKYVNIYWMDWHEMSGLIICKVLWLMTKYVQSSRLYQKPQLCIVFKD